MLGNNYDLYMGVTLVVFLLNFRVFVHLEKCMVKNQLATEGALSFREFRVMALKECLSEELTDEKALCPVRVLMFYLTCIPRPEGSWKHFVCMVARHTSEIHPNRI